jgi:hypothetical protein
MSSLRQRSTASARTANAFSSCSVSERSPFIALILQAAKYYNVFICSYNAEAQLSSPARC